MPKLRYKGHPIEGCIFRRHGYKVKEGREIDITEDDAKFLQTRYPDYFKDGTFELVGSERTVEKPVHDRMRRAPARKRRRAKT